MDFLGVNNLPQGQQAMANSVSVAIASNQSAVPVSNASATDGTAKSRITNGTIDAGIEPFGSLMVNNGFQTLFYDSWPGSTLDTTDKWTVTGNTPTIALGNMTMPATLSSYNAIRSKDAVIPNVGFSLSRNGIAIEATPAIGAGRLWGLGIPATTPAPGVLAQNAVAFEIDQATGDLLAVTYAAGVRTTLANLNSVRPSDGLTHAWGVYFRVTQAYWILDGVTVFSKSFPNVQVAELPTLIVRQNAASFTGTPLFTNIATLLADTSRQGIVLVDPIHGLRQGRIGADGLQWVNDRATTSGGLLPYSFLSTATVQAASIKASLGQVYEMVFFNVQANPVYGRLYNQATSPAAGDTANIRFRFMIPGNTSAAGFVAPIPKGLSFSAGIGIRVTSAVADNDNTALAANVIMGNVLYF